MIRWNARIAILVTLLLLAAEVTIEALSMISQTDRAVSQLREVLLQDVWAHDVRAGRVAIETRVLVFRETGEVSERIYDDTGIHEAAGKWQLEESGDSVIIVLAGERLRDKGRFTLRLDAKGEAIELREVEGKRALRFQRRKGYRPVQ